MKIGIFINYGPGTEMTKEGLGRYLGGITKGFLDNGNEVTFAYPYWLKDSLYDLFEDLNIDKNKVKHITTKKNPPLWLLYRKYKNKKRKKRNFYAWTKQYINKQAMELASKTSNILFALSILKIILLGVIASPFILILFILKKISVLLDKVLKKTKYLFKGMLSEKFVYLMYRKMIENTALELVSIINRNNKESVWYCPALFWPNVTAIKGPVVINLPDVVTQDFADKFAITDFPEQTKDLKETIKRGNYFITYSDYIKNKIIVNENSSMDKEAIVINHIPNNLLPYVEIDSAVGKKMNVDYDLTHVFCKNVIAQIPSIAGNIGRIDLSDIRYIFYSSQARPHKNMLTLIKAYKTLIRKKFRHEKLVLTGNINNLEEISRYVNDNNLQEEIIICSGVSTQELAALYECARLVVNPTLYEGGFPFTFCEGMSVGTPSLMSKIPVVNEIIDENQYSEMLFDPYDYSNLAERMEWALENVDYLYNLELDLYKKLMKRTNIDVSKEYEEAFKFFIKKYNENKKIKDKIA